MGIPRRILVILEGEGLANDATALILYRFAVLAVSAGAFSFSKAAGMFAAIVVGELLWGLVVGWLMLRLRRWVDDPQIEILLSILTPFLAYWPPWYFGGSGVLATVVAGLYVSWNGARLISAATRLQGIFFWDVLDYLIEGVVFLLTGLQARTLIIGIGRYTRRETGSFRMDLSCRVFAAEVIFCHSPRRSSASLAVAVYARIHRGPGDRFSRGSARHPSGDKLRKPLSRSRSDFPADVRRDSGDPGRAGFDAAERGPGAWPRKCRCERASD
jgi:hypothetical protein